MANAVVHVRPGLLDVAQAAGRLERADVEVLLDEVHDVRVVRHVAEHARAVEDVHLHQPDALRPADVGQRDVLADLRAADVVELAVGEQRAAGGTRRTRPCR